MSYVSYINQTKKGIIPMFQKITHLKDSDFEHIFEENKQKASSFHNTDQFPVFKNVDPTDFNGLHQEINVTSRSLKPKPGDFQISFEASFMDQHLSAFIKKTKNLMEPSLKNQNIIEFIPNNEDIFQQGNDKCHLDIMENKLLAPLERKQFLKDLQHEEKLHEFLKNISKQYDNQVIDHLVHIAYLTWEKYIQVRSPILPQSRLLKEAEKFSAQLASKLFDTGKIFFLNQKEIQAFEGKFAEQVEEKLQQYLEFFCSTIFLIVDGYFENPYMDQGNGPKRNRSFDDFGWDELCSESEDSGLGSPYKRVKTL